MHAHLRTVCLAVHITLTFTGIGFAQQPPPPKAREGKAEFALVTTSGNASTQSIGAAGQITVRPPQWVVDGQGAFVRNEAEDVVSAKSFAARGRVARVLTPRLQTFGQHSYLRDLFSGVVHRNSNLLRYVGEPVAGFEQTDTITSAALVLSF